MTLETARYQWEEGARRLEAAGDDATRHRHLVLLVEAVSDELRRRVGQTFTLTELAEAYERAEDWAREVVVRSLPDPGADARRGGGEPFRAGVRDVALIQDAAFALYARGASDYRP
jgi:hypothetical protein